VTGEVVVALVGLVGVLVTAVITALATAAKVKQDLEADYDLALRDERLAAYRELWRRLEPLAKYFRAEEVTYRRLRELGTELRSWYFHTGGIYLTAQSRDAYFHLQDGLHGSVEAGGEHLDRELDPPAFEELRERGSSLRSSLVADVRTRRESALAEDDGAY
jgi:hypothetical protein